MISEKFFYQRLQLNEVRGCGEQNLLFRSKMNSNLSFELLLDLSLPSFKIDFACPKCTIKPDAERQRMLVLPRKRDQVLVAQHREIINDAGKLRTLRKRARPRIH